MYFNYRGQDIYYEITGNGPQLVMLHGWGVNANSFSEIVKNIKEKYQVITIDLLGFGMSDEPHKPLTLDEYTESIYLLLCELKIDVPIILGHSFGGRIAIKYARIHPVTSIILVDSAGIKHRSIKIKYRIISYKIKKHIYRIFKPKQLKDLTNKAGSSDYRNATDIMKKTMSNVINIDLRNDIKKLKCKALILWGFKDLVTPIEDAHYMNKNIKDSKLIIFYNSGHFPYLDEQDKFIKILMKGGV
jgi:pimeloyl-ACP methyl ester carboxylesterase